MPWEIRIEGPVCVIRSVSLGLGRQTDPVERQRLRPSILSGEEGLRLIGPIWEGEIHVGHAQQMVSQQVVVHADSRGAISIVNVSSHGHTAIPLRIDPLALGRVADTGLTWIAVVAWQVPLVTWEACDYGRAARGGVLRVILDMSLQHITRRAERVCSACIPVDRPRRWDSCWGRRWDEDGRSVMGS